MERAVTKETNSQTDIELRKLVLASELLGKEWLTDESITHHTNLINNGLLRQYDMYIIPPLIV